MGDSCIEKIADCGLRIVTLSLDEQTLALVRVAVVTPTGDEQKLRDRMTAARAARVPSLWMEELLLQSFLNVGYPLALVAFGVWQTVAGPDAQPSEPVAHPEWEQWTKSGVRSEERRVGKERRSR